MSRFGGQIDMTAMKMTDSLMPQTDSEDRNGFLHQYIAADTEIPGAVRPSRSR